MSTTEITTESLLTSSGAGSLLQVDPSSIHNWVKAGHIPAFRTPGGHLRIRAGDLVEFVEKRGMSMPRRLATISSRRLLVVDDDKRQLRAVGRVLRAYRDRLQTQLVDNGIDALVAVGSFQPHVIVLDVVMPELDGIEVCRRLKAKPETADIRVVIATGHPTDEVKQRAEQAGADRFIVKPISIDLILQDLGIGQQARAG